MILTVDSVLGSSHRHLPDQNHQLSQRQHTRSMGWDILAGWEWYARGLGCMPWLEWDLRPLLSSGLFCVTGLGLIPWRVKDSYRTYPYLNHQFPPIPFLLTLTFLRFLALSYPEYTIIGVIRIWFHKRRTRKLRAKAGLLPLLDPDDLPDPMYDVNYVHVLNEKEQADLHKRKFCPYHHLRKFSVDSRLMMFVVDWVQCIQNSRSLWSLRPGTGRMEQRHIGYVIFCFR